MYNTMRHAYLIIANRNHSQLQKLITMLDDSRNDIYLMIDKKSIDFPINFNVNYSTLNYVAPINIYWGSYSQIQAELDLFKAAAPEHYTYYHLLSGLDLPLVNQDKIHEFFDYHLNREFITYGNPSNIPNLPNRLKHHLFRKSFRTDNLFIKIFRKLEKYYINLLREPIQKNKLAYASNWVSIDDKLIHTILKNSMNIKRIYRYGYLEDEVFIPTLLNYYPRLKQRVYYNKPVHDKPNEFQGNMRYINWWDGSPYTWQLKDYPKLIKAEKMGHLFSRKFDSNIDDKVINKIFNDVMK